MVADTQAYSSGKATGMNRMASSTSRPRVSIVMVDSSVPTPATPTVPTASGTAISGVVAASSAPERKNRKNSGTESASTARRKIRLEVALAANTTARSTGASRMPSRQPDSVSCEKLRFRPSRLVKTMSAHSIPPASDTVCTRSPTWDSAAP